MFVISGSRIAEVLEKSGWSTDGFARAIGMTPDDVRAVIAGSLEPSEEQRLALEAGLGGLAWVYVTCRLPGPDEWPYRIVDGIITNADGNITAPVIWEETVKA